MLSLFTLAATVAVAFSANEIKDTISDVTSTKGGAEWCPVFGGTQCPSSSFVHYYNCCGTLNKDCCFALQTWVIVVLALIGVIALASLVLSLIRCVFCRR
ncbi:unnamed protein product, partial [Mesorhabditis belari]|uniref:Uncharacterized protein n=1 Tax=Mesorhabditis belari TaxID=2138241 RepID=A0AAF3EA57_9BILA